MKIGEFTMKVPIQEVWRERWVISYFKTEA
jgi:hypothetical protein